MKNCQVKSKYLVSIHPFTKVLSIPLVNHPTCGIVIVSNTNRKKGFTFPKVSISKSIPEQH